MMPSIFGNSPAYLSKVSTRRTLKLLCNSLSLPPSTPPPTNICFYFLSAGSAFLSLIAPSFKNISENIFMKCYIYKL